MTFDERGSSSTGSTSEEGAPSSSSPSSFSYPMITEHQAKCEYSSERRLCPKPVECQEFSVGDRVRMPHKLAGYCDEIPKQEKVGEKE